VEIEIINTTHKFDRDTLRDRIETRFRRRLSEGMVEEVRRDKAEI
jgi:tRNA A37 N6-isopentenylltransferase MiaA